MVHKEEDNDEHEPTTVRISITPAPQRGADKQLLEKEQQEEMYDIAQRRREALSEQRRKESEEHLKTCSAFVPTTTTSTSNSSSSSSSKINKAALKRLRETFVPLQLSKPGYQVAENSLWIRPICPKCDKADIVFLDKMCFPTESIQQIEHTANHIFDSAAAASKDSNNNNNNNSGSGEKSFVGFIVVKDVRPQSYKSNNHSNESGFFSNVFSCISASCSEEEDNTPLPPKKNESVIVAYATARIRSTKSCRQELSASLCSMTKKVGQNFCIDLTSIAVSPAFRGRGLAEQVINKTLAKAYCVALNCQEEKINKKKNQKEMMNIFVRGGKEDGAEADYEDESPNSYNNRRRCRRNNNNRQKDGNFYLRGEESVSDCDDQQEDDEEEQDPFVVTGEKQAEKKKQQQLHHDPWPATVQDPNKYAVHVCLCVRSDNVAAIKLYKKLGFVLEEFKKNYQRCYGDGCPMHRLGKFIDLTSSSSSSSSSM